MAEQRLPYIDGDDGSWGDILNQYLSKEHYDTGLDDVANGGHQKITIRPGSTSAGTAPLKFTSGSLLTAAEAGAIEYDGEFYMTRSGNARTTIVGTDVTQTLTNKTLTDPKIGTIKDANGNTILDLPYQASAVNHIYFGNQPTGNSPTLGVDGSDTNINLSLQSKGTGVLYVLRTNGHSTVQAGGAFNSGNVNLELNSQGTGVVNANSNPVLTSVTGIPAVTGTPSSSNYLRGDGTWATPAGGGGGGMLMPAQALALGSETFTIASGSVTQIAGTTINGGYAPAIGDRILIVNAPASTGTGTAYGTTTQPANGIYTVTGNTTNLSLSRAADMSGSENPSGLFVWSQSGPGWSEQTLWHIKTPVNSDTAFTWGTTAVEFRPVLGGNGNTAIFSLDTTVFTIHGTSNAVQLLQNSSAVADQTLTLPAPTTDTIVSRSSTDTLTNKTLTDPKINIIKDGGGANALSIGTTASAVNYIGITNQTTGNAPGIQASGTDTNINLLMAAKGTGSVGIYTSTGVTPTLAATGADTNLDLNIQSKGTGKVTANGNPVLSSVTSVPAITGTPSSSNYLRGDGTWATPAGGGGGGSLAPVRVATVGAETYTISSGTVTQISGTTVDGVSPSVGDRILITTAPATSGAGTLYSYTTQPTNGIYTVTSNTTNLSVSRATDLSGAINPAGLSAYVQEGAIWEQSVWWVVDPSTSGSFTYGTDAMLWTSFVGFNPHLGTGYFAAINIYQNGAYHAYLENSPDATAVQTLTLPAPTTDTIVSRTSTDTLTNKTISGTANTITDLPQEALSYTNLLTTNPSFTSNITGWTQGSGTWTWDNTVGHLAVGSAKVILDGSYKEISSTKFTVTAGTTYNFEAWVSGSSITNTSGGIYLFVNTYNGVALVSSYVWPDTFGDGTNSIYSASGTITWRKIYGQFVIPDSGVDGIVVSVGVDATLTAGSLWLDDFAAYATNVNLGWVGGLGKALDSVMTPSSTNTLTNKTISGANNTITNLSASSITDYPEKVVSPSGDTSGATDIAAINAAIGSGDVVVRLRPGIYYINASIVLKNHTRLVGAGMLTTAIRLANSSNVSMVKNYVSPDGTIANAEFVSVKDLSLEGNKANQTSGHGIEFNMYPLYAAATNDDDYDSHQLVENVRIRYCKQDGFNGQGRSETRLINVYADGCNGYGFAPSYDTFLVSCTASWSGLAGFRLVQSSIVAVGCKSFYSGQITASAGHGFHLTNGTYGINLSSCVAQDNEASGYTIDSASQATMASCSADSNSTSSAGTYPGLDMWAATNSNITGFIAFERRSDGSNSYQQSALRIRSSSTSNRIDLTHSAVNGASVGVAITGSSTTTGNTIIVNGTTVESQVLDTGFTLQDNSDTTKQAKFELSGITTATTRTYSLPNASGTLALQSSPGMSPTSNLIYDGNFENNGTWTNAWGVMSSAQAYVGTQSRLLTATTAGTATDRITLTHDGTGTASTVQLPTWAVVTGVIRLRKHASNTGNSNLYLRLHYNDGSEQTVATSTITESSISSAAWTGFYSQFNTNGTQATSYYLTLEIDSAVANNNIFYLDGVNLVDTSVLSGFQGLALDVQNLNLSSSTNTFPASLPNIGGSIAFSSGLINF